MQRSDLCCNARNIPNFPKYWATECGKIWSEKSSKFLATSTNTKINYDYLRVGLSHEGKYKTSTIHRLMADAFGIYVKGMHINHIDGDKRNNKLSNLEAVTPSQNSQHAFDMGLQKKFIGSLSHRAKLTEEQAIYIIKNYQRHSHGKSNSRELGKMFGVNPSCITDVVRGFTWPHLSEPKHTRKALLTKEDVVYIIQNCRPGEALKSIKIFADMFDVNRATISAIYSGRTWRHVTGFKDKQGDARRAREALKKEGGK